MFKHHHLKKNNNSITITKSSPQSSHRHKNTGLDKKELKAIYFFHNKYNNYGFLPEFSAVEGTEVSHAVRVEVGLEAPPGATVELLLDFDRPSLSGMK